MDLENFARACIREVWTEGRLDRIAHYYADDFVCAQPRPSLNWTDSPSITWNGPAGVRAAVEAVRSVFPDYSETPELVIASSDMVAMRMINRGTHTGRALGSMPATGRAFEVVDTMFVRVANEKIVEQWGLFDEFGVAIQLGLIEPPELTVY